MAASSSVGQVGGASLALRVQGLFLPVQDAATEGPSSPPTEQKSGNSQQQTLQPPPDELQAIDKEGKHIYKNEKENPEIDGCYKPREGTVIPSSQKGYLEVDVDLK